MESEFSRTVRQNRRSALYWGLVYWFLAMIVFGGHLYSGDAEAYFLVAVKLLTFQAPTMPTFLEGFAAPGLGGALYSKFGLGLSLQIMPLLFVQFVIAIVTGAAPLSGAELRAAALLVSPIVGGAGTYLFHRLQYRLGLDRTSRTVGTLFLVAPGLWLVYSRFLFSELSVAVCLLVVLYGLTHSSRRGDWLVGLGTGWALLLRLDALALTLPLLVVRWYRGRGREPRVPLGVPVSLAALITGAYNAFRYGSPFYTGMGHSEVETFSTPVLKGLIGQFFAPGNGLFVYEPHLAVALTVYLLVRWHRSDWPTLYEGAFLAGSLVYLVVHSAWHSWMGGWSWGPRRMMPLLPLFALTVPMTWRWMDKRLRRLMVALLGLSGLLNLGGLLVNFNRYYRGTFYQVDVLFHPGHAQILRQNLGLWTGQYPLDLFWFRLLPWGLALMVVALLGTAATLSLRAALPDAWAEEAAVRVSARWPAYLRFPS